MKNRIITLILLIIFCFMALIITFLMIERNERNMEVEELNQKIIISDSISQIKIKKLDSIIDKKNSIIDTLNSNKEFVNGFVMGDRSISLEELLKIINVTLTENSKLETQVKNDKIIIKHIEDSYGIKVVIDSLGIVTLKLNSDSRIKDYENKTSDRLNKLSEELEEKRFILNNLQKRYGFKYEVRTEGNKINSTIYTTKLDSAMWLYPHYKHKIKQDKNGDTYVK